MVHRPVLIKEVIKYLDPKPNENFIDCTLGESGHAVEILKKIGPHGKLLGIDLDPQQIENSKLNTVDFDERLILINDSYANLKEIVEKINFESVQGILLDLGMSSWHLEKSAKGFSFLKDEVLDMRYSVKQDLTARKIVNEYTENEIKKILSDFGEEKFSRQIAKKIVEQRKIKEIESTFQLKSIIEKSIPAKFRKRKINFSTLTFQALRIAVNKELDNLTKVLPQALEVLFKNGRLITISFHSLEDRIIKNFFKNKEKENLVKILTKKPISASSNEISTNPRARSAKLRAIVKI